ncbi:hypothetical protein T4E_2939 [Trichinella pseudospiralis]|uniref:Uncharacterized protein n=1 Tax=Trichinella pseudospiralis TaxID=6337 RepID=A0A0V1FG51_TRIPS|nr:hypothetical protein T4E_3896 [Trichinella pseudospiralis]KRX90601.1 hypothetical protein T4E_2939 [Trichinella pseudospiralis]KRY84940.1 hypothetical protein T4D_15644 [Trichinella pseudospiralis]
MLNNRVSNNKGFWAALLAVIEIAVSPQQSPYVQYPAEPLMSNLCEYLPLLFIQSPAPDKCICVFLSGASFLKALSSKKYYDYNMSELVDQSKPTVWNRGIGATIYQLSVRSAPLRAI